MFKWNMSTIDKLFDYDDYRLFLKDYFDEQKKLRSIFSHRFFAAKAGFSSSSYCLNVIRGRFNLTEKSIAKMVKAMNLNNIQSKYFFALVEYNQAKQVEERENAWDEIVQIRSKNEFVHISEDQQDFFSKWYYPVLRELVCQPAFDGDMMRLARMVVPAIPTEEARVAVENMIRWNLIQKTVDGKFQKTAEMIDAKNVSPMNLRKIRREYVQQAIGAIESKKAHERFAAFTTLAMSESSYDYAVKILEEARQKIMAKAADDPEVEKIYEMMILMYPLSEKLKTEDAK